MRLLKNSYLQEFPAPPRTDPVISRAKLKSLFEKVSLADDDFTVERFPPGSSGEKLLYDTLRAQLNV